MESSNIYGHTAQCTLLRSRGGGGGAVFLKVSQADLQRQHNVHVLMILHKSLTFCNSWSLDSIFLPSQLNESSSLLIPSTFSLPPPLHPPIRGPDFTYPPVDQWEAPAWNQLPPPASSSFSFSFFHNTPLLLNLSSKAS